MNLAKRMDKRGSQEVTDFISVHPNEVIMDVFQKMNTSSLKLALIRFDNKWVGSFSKNDYLENVYIYKKDPKIVTVGSCKSAVFEVNLSSDDSDLEQRMKPLKEKGWVIVTSSDEFPTIKLMSSFDYLKQHWGKLCTENSSLAAIAMFDGFGG